MGASKPSAEDGSIVCIVGRERVYGIRGHLQPPKSYSVPDTKRFAELKVSDPIADKHNYFDAYFSLSPQTDGENARTEAGVFKYAGSNHMWRGIRTGVGVPRGSKHPPSGFHGNFMKDKDFEGKTHVLELAFLPENEKFIDFKIDGVSAGGRLKLNFPISRETFNSGGLYPKASIGLCDFSHEVGFGKTTFSNLEVNHDPHLRARGWKPFMHYIKYNKFTNGDVIDSEYAPFSAWMNARKSST